MYINMHKYTHLQGRYLLKLHKKLSHNMNGLINNRNNDNNCFK